MALPESVSEQLPNAAVAATVIVLLDALAAERSAPVPLLTDFALYLVALLVGFVLVDALRSYAFGGNDA
jgi:hypothetical protein